MLSVLVEVSEDDLPQAWLDELLDGDGPAREVLVFGGGRAATSDQRIRTLGDVPLLTAVSAAVGRYLVVVAPTTRALPGAWDAAIALLDRTGSDLAVGKDRSVQSAPWASELFAHARERQTVETCPVALVDLSLSNKVFRTSLVRSLPGLEVPSGAAVALSAYVAASRFDVIAEVVSEPASTVPARPVPDPRAASVAAWVGELDRLAAAAPAGWRELAMTHLMPVHYAEAVAAGDAYLEALRPGLARLMTGVDPDEVPVEARLGAWVVMHGSSSDNARLQDWLADNRHGLPVTNGVVDVPPGLDALPPEQWRAVRDIDRRLRSWVAGLAVPSVAGWLIRGATFVEYVAEPPLPALEISGTGRRLPLRPVATTDPRVNEWAARSWEDHSDAAWTTFVEAAAISPSQDELVLEVRVGERTVSHRVRLARGPQPGDKGAAVGGATLGEGVLRLRGTAPHSPGHVRLTGPKGGVEGVVTGGDSGFEAAVPLAVEAFGEASGLPLGRYELRLDASGGRSSVQWSPAMTADPPELRDGRHRVVPVGDRVAAVLLRSPLSPRERSALGQQELQSSVYAAPASSPSPTTVLLETFRGRSIGDNPGALGRELLRRDVGLDLVWVVDDPGVVVPEGTRAVVRRSQQWYEALATAGTYVSNAGAPYWFEKKRGQIHLQTWHGTPLKRIGEDRGPGDFATWRHRRRIAGQAAGWDAMLSPSPYCSRIFRTAFQYDGPMLELGSPRNDVLVTDTVGLRRRTRERLKLRSDDRVVLYAPTWRDYAGVRNSKPLYLDAERVSRQLPEAVVLVRGHYNSTDQRAAFSDHPRIQDVTRYPDIADLFLAADVLVTDYSSVMFDFVLTDKPIVLLVPDLDQYREVERGFYFDIESRSPGPMVATTDEVVEAVQAPDRHADVRAAFREEFCPHDDGHVSARTVDDLLGRL